MAQIAFIRKRILRRSPWGIVALLTIAVMLVFAQVGKAETITVLYVANFIGSTTCNEDTLKKNDFYGFDNSCTANGDGSVWVNCSAADPAQVLTFYDSSHDCTGDATVNSPGPSNPFVLNQCFGISLGFGGGGSTKFLCRTMPYVFTKTLYSPGCNGTAGSADFAVTPDFCMDNKQGLLLDESTLQISTWSDNTVCTGEPLSTVQVTLNSCSDGVEYAVIGDPPLFSESPSTSPSKTPSRAPSTLAVITKTPTSDSSLGRVIDWSVLSFCLFMVMMTGWM